MTRLLLAAILFVGSHFAISSTPVRPALVRRLGERAYLGLYALLALALFALLLWSYGRAPYLPLWDAPGWTRWIPILVMPFALLLLVGGYSGRNPTAVGQRPGAEPPRGILAVTRHPLMWAFALWALAHVPPNGDAASLVLFASIAVLGLAGTLLLDRKKARQWPPETWVRFAGATSNLPFAAIAGGRNRLRPADIAWWQVGLALLLYLALVWLHPLVIGVPVIVH